MNRIVLFISILLKILFLNPLVAQKPVDSIPRYIVHQCFRTFDSLVNYDSRVPMGKLQFINHKKEYEYLYSSSSPDSGVAYLLIKKGMLTGDIDNDGKSELIITAIINYGGSGSYGYEFVFRSRNQHWDLLTYLEDFDVYLENIQIDNGELVGTTIGWDKDDAHCCPSLIEENRYKYDPQKNQFEEVSSRVVGKIANKDGK